MKVLFPHELVQLLAAKLQNPKGVKIRIRHTFQGNTRIYWLQSLMEHTCHRLYLRCFFFVFKLTSIWDNKFAFSPRSPPSFRQSNYMHTRYIYIIFRVSVLRYGYQTATGNNNCCWLQCSFSRFLIQNFQ